MGCVSMSSRHFGDGEITEKRMKRARLAARLELEPVQAGFRTFGWEHAFGASGTVRAVGDVLRARNNGESAITPAGVEAVIDQVSAAGSLSKIRLPGLPADRLPVFVGGLVVLAETLQALDIKSMRVADGALREGLLYDMVGRFTDEDARVLSVRAMEARYHVDGAQAARVEQAALEFLQQTREAWSLDEPLAELVLSWAARLHEIGLDVSHSHYQKHGAYLLEHADLPGFPQEEQRILACLVGAHRRKLHAEALQDLSPPWHIKAEFLVVLLRLAVLLHRGRGPSALPAIRLAAKGRALEAAFPRGWLEANPLTAADLDNEIEYLKVAGFRLKVV
jgi:exopolyphosphatase/guanosine-5'-triphosphate,3'-diphosphate pyrophosphatase